jgi:RimK family alpha-L-glutamate ligase
MFQTAIISDIHDWHTEKIEYFLKKNGCVVTRLKFNEIKLSFCADKKTFFNKNIHKLDAVWVRLLNGKSLEEITTKLTYLHLLHDLNIYIHNSAVAIEKTVDKVRTTGLLKINGIPSPDTDIWIGRKKKNNVTNDSLLKPIFGSQGKGIILVKKNTNLSGVKGIGDVYYLQNFIGELKDQKFSDLRILVSNHKVIASMKRESKSFLTNVYLGASYHKTKISSETVKLTEKISRIFELGYGGIDIKIKNKKIFILEINSIPSWKNINKLYKKDLTEKLVKDFIKIIKKFKKCQSN